MKYKLKINGEITEVEMNPWVKLDKWATSDGEGCCIYFWNTEPYYKEEDGGYHQVSLIQNTLILCNGPHFKLTIKDFLDKYEARHSTSDGEWLTNEEHEEFHSIEKIPVRREDGIFGTGGTVPVDQSGNILTPQELGGFLRDSDDDKYDHLKKEYRGLSENYKILTADYHSAVDESKVLKETIVSMAIKLEKK